VQDQGCGKVVLKTPQTVAKAATAVPAGSAGSSGGAGSVRQKVPKFDEFQIGLSLPTANLPPVQAPAALKRVAAPQAPPPPPQQRNPARTTSQKEKGYANKPGRCKNCNSDKKRGKHSKSLGAAGIGAAPGSTAVGFG
jgi:hypothetical protein